MSSPTLAVIYQDMVDEFEELLYVMPTRRERSWLWERAKKHWKSLNLNKGKSNGQKRLAEAATG